MTVHMIVNDKKIAIENGKFSGDARLSVRIQARMPELHMAGTYAPSDDQRLASAVIELYPGSKIVKVDEEKPKDSKDVVYEDGRPIPYADDVVVRTQPRTNYGDLEGGRWITIGAQSVTTSKGGGKSSTKKEGGTPVYIKGGKIISGRTPGKGGLKGKSLSDLSGKKAEKPEKKGAKLSKPQERALKIIGHESTKFPIDSFTAQYLKISESTAKSLAAKGLIGFEAGKDGNWSITENLDGKKAGVSGMTDKEHEINENARIDAIDGLMEDGTKTRKQAEKYLKDNPEHLAHALQSAAESLESSMTWDRALELAGGSKEDAKKPEKKEKKERVYKKAKKVSDAQWRALSAIGNEKGGTHKLGPGNSDWEMIGGRDVKMSSLNKLEDHKLIRSLTIMNKAGYSGSAFKITAKGKRALGLTGEYEGHKHPDYMVKPKVKQHKKVSDAQWRALIDLSKLGDGEHDGYRMQSTISVGSFGKDHNEGSWDKLEEMGLITWTNDTTFKITEKGKRAVGLTEEFEGHKHPELNPKRRKRKDAGRKRRKKAGGGFGGFAYGEASKNEKGKRAVYHDGEIYFY